MLITFAVLLVIHFVFNTVSVLALLFISVLLAVFLRALTDWLTAHTPLGSRPAFGVVVLACLLLAVGLGVLLGPRLAAQTSQLVEQIPQSLDALEERIWQYDWGRQLLDQMPDLDFTNVNGILTDSAGIIGRVTGIFSGVVEFLGQVLIIGFTALYLAFEPSTYVDNLLRLVPVQSRDLLHKALRASDDMLKKWILARFVSMLVTAGIIFTGLMLLGLPFALSLAVIAALLAFVPTFGPILSLIPALLIGFLQSPTTALIVLGIYLGAQFIDNYIVSPLLQREMLSLPPALIISAQVVLGVLVGQVGLLIAAPLVAALVPLVRVLYVDAILEPGVTDPAVDSAQD